MTAAIAIASPVDPTAPPGPGVVNPQTLAELYAARLRLAPEAEACRRFDVPTQQWRTYRWREIGALARRYAGGMQASGLRQGDRVALQVPNGPDWLALDWAAHSLGLITVGLFADETPAGTVQLLEDSGARLLVTRDLESWRAVSARSPLPGLHRVVALRAGPGAIARNAPDDARVVPLEVFMERDAPLPDSGRAAGELASIVYTSGATGRPKGVMQSQAALLANARAVQERLGFRGDDLVFSNLPLAHLFGRVAWIYAGMLGGASLMFGRGAGLVAEDLATQRPTVLIGAPRLFERIHGTLTQDLERGSAARRALFNLAVETGWANATRRDGSRRTVRLLPSAIVHRTGDALRARLGGRVRLAVSGGAALSPQIGRTFAALGVPLLQGYGLTEAGPVVSVNRIDDNDPASVGTPLSGVEIRIEATGELSVRSPSVMIGYWNDDVATRDAIDDAGWLRSGDKVSRLDTDRIYLVGRFKELLVTATGEKASPADIESRLRELSLIEQVMVVGEARPYLTALIVPQPGPLALLRAEVGLIDGDDSPAARDAIEGVLLRRCQDVLQNAPRNHWIVGVALVMQPWTPGNGMLTATQKLRRCEIARAHAHDIDRLYEGHYRVPATDCSNNASL
ncbi:MAG: AMP-forming long-chain acyl-CoA synthetase [Panacagrimonas sp.]|jgi:long-chain acyl-CoA synthetase|nr:AMP-binding protein [Panacagrimonas sp.]MCC2655998.1 AMP-forming long-chain acyl-CoA synthetase [Panacagrimonas sp.]